MGAASVETTLTVYTALEADQTKVYQAAIEKANPDIKIQWVRDSTGIIAAKLWAQKSNPKADVIWGLADNGRASCRERVCPYVSLSVVVVSFTNISSTTTSEF